MTPDTDVVVIGGGATGCSVARDLSMRGLAVVLLERDSINAGTSGRSHGVLHSGARYADADPESAAACRRENRVLRRIAGAAIRDTGGYFLQLEVDDPDYLETKLAACRDVGIDATGIDRETVLTREPAVTGTVERALAVPDAVVYPSRFVAATAESARQHGARIEAGAAVRGISFPGHPTVSVEGDVGTITAEHVVNAAGAWSGSVAALAGLTVPMAPTRGLMLTVPNPGVSTVLNRCRPPDDGDIVVPHPDDVVCGTTSVPVDDPDRPNGTSAEVETVRREVAAMVPGVGDGPIRRRFWGVRPLAQSGGRGSSRGFLVFDHGTRDGVAGMTTVVGGKLTTARLMAETVGDHVADRLDLEAPARAAEEPLPGHDDPGRLDELVAAYGASGPADEDVLRNVG